MDNALDNILSSIKHYLADNLWIIVVAEAIGWGVVPATAIGHLFRERLADLSLLISGHSTERWLAVNGTAIDLNKIGYQIPWIKQKNKDLE